MDEDSSSEEEDDEEMVEQNVEDPKFAKVELGIDELKFRVRYVPPVRFDEFLINKLAVWLYVQEVYSFFVKRLVIWKWTIK